MRRPGRHARRPAVEPSATEAAPGWGTSDGTELPAESPGGGTASGHVDEPHEHTAPVAMPGVLAPLVDRLPLPLRAVLGALPAGIRQGSAGLHASHALVLVLVVALALAVTAVVTGLGRPRVAVVEPAGMSTVLATGTPIPGGQNQTGEDDARSAGTEDAEPADVVVHVIGRVARPGIVVLPAGSRVVDAVDAAGGLDGEVDLALLNLARAVVDGEQIFVGIDPPPGAPPPMDAGTGEQGTTASGLVDLNAATSELLETLPGIGPALAQRIVQWREQNGRFSAVEELLEVSGIGPAKYAAIAELVTV